MITHSTRIPLFLILGGAILASCAGRSEFLAGRAFYQEGQYRSAFQRFYLATQLAPDDEEYARSLEEVGSLLAREHCQSAWQAERTGDRGQALDRLVTAWEYSPQNALVLGSLRHLLDAQVEEEAAVSFQGSLEERSSSGRKSIEFLEAELKKSAALEQDLQEACKGSVDSDPDSLLGKVHGQLQTLWNMQVELEADTSCPAPILERICRQIADLEACSETWSEFASKASSRPRLAGGDLAEVANFPAIGEELSAAEPVRNPSLWQIEPWFVIVFPAQGEEEIDFNEEIWKLKRSLVAEFENRTVEEFQLRYPKSGWIGVVEVEDGASITAIRDVDLDRKSVV